MPDWPTSKLHLALESAPAVASVNDRMAYEEIPVELRRLADEFDPDTETPDPTLDGWTRRPGDASIFPPGGTANLEYWVRANVVTEVTSHRTTRKRAARDLRELADDDSHFTPANKASLEKWV